MPPIHEQSILPHSSISGTQQDISIKSCNCKTVQKKIMMVTDPDQQIDAGFNLKHSFQNFGFLCVIYGLQGRKRSIGQLKGHTQRPRRILSAYARILILFKNTGFETRFVGITYVLYAYTGLQYVFHLTVAVQKDLFRGKTSDIRNHVNMKIKSGQWLRRFIDYIRPWESLHLEPPVNCKFYRLTFI